MMGGFNCRHNYVPITYEWFEDVTFSSVMADVRRYRPDLKLELQVEQYRNLIDKFGAFAFDKKRVKAKDELLKIIEKYFKRTILN